MDKLKVLQIIPMLAPGGAERVVVHIAQGLDRRRFDVGVVSIWHRVGSDLEKMLDESNVRTWYLGKTRGFDARTYVRLHRVLREYAPHVVHTHLHVLRYALPSFLLLKGTSYLHTVHNQAEREVEPRARWMQRYALTHTVTPIAVSQNVADSLKRCYGIENSTVVPNGIPTAHHTSPVTPRELWRSREGFGEDQILFVCVARLAAQKNQALLLRAFSLGPARDPRAHLVLIGDGPLRETLTLEARNLGLSNRVHFLGVRTDIADALGAMDVFVLSSDWEGNPLSVMEAMAAGLPIVSTAVGGVAELVTDGIEGFLVAPKDGLALSNAMDELMRRPETKWAMGAAARRRARDRFDVSGMVRHYEELYERIFDRHIVTKKQFPQPTACIPERGLQ